MSSDETGQREVAHRLFAAEYDDAEYSYSEGDEEQAPNYVVTPAGARVNRLFVGGVLTEVERVNDEMLRGRVADPTGAFVLYAGQYQPDEQAMLEQTDPPAFVAVTGKAHTFQPEDSDRVYTSIRPESINTVDAETRDRWTVQAAEQTLDRVGTMATALSTGLTGETLRETLEDRGVDPALADGISRALTHYGTTAAYLDGLRDLALDAARVVAGRRDEVRGLAVAPDDPGDATAAELVAGTPETDLHADRAGVGASESDTASAAGTPTGDTGADDTTASGLSEREPERTEQTTEPGQTASERGTASGSETTAGSDTPSERAATSGSETTAETTDDTAVDTTDTDPTEDAVADSTAVELTGDTVADGTDTETAGTGEDLDEFEPGEFDLPDEVREEVEEEYGTGFQSGTEVDDPGEADMPTPDTETAPVADPESTDTVDPGANGDAGATGPVGTASDVAGGADESTDRETETRDSAETETETEESAETETETEESTETETETEDSAETETEAKSGAVEDPQDAVLAVMEELDDGSGADRETLVAEAGERHGLTEEAVAEAIQDALMDGQCYEPDERSLKPI